MKKQELLNKTVETLSPFETGNIVNFMRNVTMKSAMESPWIIGIFLVIAFYAIVKRSKFVLGFLFSAIAIMLLIRFTLPAEGESEITLGSTLPFAFGGLAIGGALIYFIFIKSE
ncbi:hypothetical protein [Geotalea uraniireducens]|uniref:Uncharacterized protein n=1 Tax=Geotalea uraniireducens (strain Rf4) TaxID=351605 RepID=A5GCJ0_GEOUR|nr:hypothetical protein [Geotalea uraniireducens]ABQ24701.1 hypothetical protein Gura_0486 [Geotalea uraniireducens Rf4]